MFRTSNGGRLVRITITAFICPPKTFLTSPFLDKRRSRRKRILRQSTSRRSFVAVSLRHVPRRKYDFTAFPSPVVALQMHKNTSTRSNVMHNTWSLVRFDVFQTRVRSTSIAIRSPTPDHSDFCPLFRNQ